MIGLSKAYFKRLAFATRRVEIKKRSSIVKKKEKSGLSEPVLLEISFKVLISNAESKK